jgi:hypothetical protein
MSRFDTLAEVKRQCTLLARSDDDYEQYAEELKKAEEEAGPINIKIRDRDQFFIFTNMDNSYLKVIDYGMFFLYKTINHDRFKIKSNKVS